VALGKRRDWRAESLFLASGKHDIRGHSRLRSDGDGALGLRLRLPSTLIRRRLIGDATRISCFRVSRDPWNLFDYSSSVFQN
jgi:hypothetical protein